MKKIFTIAILAICIIALFIMHYLKNNLVKGGDTKIAYWKFNSSVNGNKKFSLADTIISSKTKKGCIAPRK